MNPVGRVWYPAAPARTSPAYTTSATAGTLRRKPTARTYPRPDRPNAQLNPRKNTASTRFTTGAARSPISAPAAAAVAGTAHHAALPNGSTHPAGTLSLKDRTLYPAASTAPSAAPATTNTPRGNGRRVVSAPLG